jgi:uncharacterized DUF497 family protein
LCKLPGNFHFVRQGISSQSVAGQVARRYASNVNFEWDEQKNRENIRKHGLDFEDVWEVFKGPLRVNLDTRVDYGEDRWTGIGLLGNRIVVVTFIMRGTLTRRIISLRKASRHERKKFEEEIRDGLGAD